MTQKFLAGIRSFLGSTKNHNTLEIIKDDNGLVLVIQEQNDCGRMRSQGVRIEKISGDQHQIEIFQLIEKLADAVKKAHEKNPNHPVFIIEKK